MAKQFLILLAFAAIGGGIYFSMNYEVQSQVESGKRTWRIASRTASPVGSAPGEPTAASFRPTIRIATFQLGRLDDARLANRRVSDVLVRLLPRVSI